MFETAAAMCMFRKDAAGVMFISEMYFWYSNVYVEHYTPNDSQLAAAGAEAARGLAMARTWVTGREPVTVHPESGPLTATTIVEPSRAAPYPDIHPAVGLPLQYADRSQNLHRPEGT